MTYYHYFPSPFGKIYLVGNDGGLSRLLVDNGTKPFEISDDWIRSEERFKEAVKQLREYFSGERKAFDLKLNPAGTDFQKTVWQALAEIPYGESHSYKDVAVKVGNPKASRAVGMANNKNPLPIIVPCHRVVGANGKLTGYAYGLEMKRRLLDLEKVTRLFGRLIKRYGYLEEWWPAESEFEIMVGAVLTQNTNWKNVEKALANFNGKLSPEFIEKTETDELSEIIRPSGFHNQKAVKLKALCEWFAKYEYDTERVRRQDGETLRTELLSVKGVGGETADSVLNYAFDKPYFVIDAYTRRIFGRMGVQVPEAYVDLRLMAQSMFPASASVYKAYHGLIVEHAKAHCKKTPDCVDCPVNDLCEFKFERNVQQRAKIESGSLFETA
ncbi:hypothetical protein FUAX_22720 [Fulvitalea axinellae]|uniref:Methylated-DNA--protein-cysteine methyltransferase n=1 Tax=Fulvitalea axinellae TaxID=1182444 RepID=A0AAU9DBR9_9BACT|nr:hypothetical protein FUAX_22720 [Fulvitalea axinellae]